MGLFRKGGAKLGPHSFIKVVTSATRLSYPNYSWTGGRILTVYMSDNEKKVYYHRIYYGPWKRENQAGGGWFKKKPGPKVKKEEGKDES